ncbi:MAG: hypothetical protein ACI8PZ_000408 [Myxococcota bacterium]|jgi:hypothetical protein
MSKTFTFLQLSSEFGGTRFGPFTGFEIRLGSDPGRNDITLPEQLGVAPEHVKILRQQDGSFILAPVDRTASVFYWRANSTKPRQISAPLAIQNGDGFSLVTAEGPRFYVILEEDQAAAVAKAEDSQGPGLAQGMGQNLNAGGIFGEIKRRGLAKVLTTGLGNTGMKAWTFIRTGQFLSPLYIVAFMMMASGWLMAGGVSCAALSFRSSGNELQGQLTNCKDQLGVGDEAEGGPTVPGLTKKILVDRTWKATIENDKDLATAYANELKKIFAEPSRYEWVYKNRGSDFVRFKKALDATFPENLVRVLAYAAAQPQVDREWYLVGDSDGEEVCGRGPLALTYRQGYRLNLLDLQPDALVDRRLAAGNNLAEQKSAIEATVSGADSTVTIDEGSIRSAGAQLMGGSECLYMDGPDDRNDPSRLAEALGEKLGTSVGNLPRESDDYWISSRLMMLYATDFRRGFEELDFRDRKAPSMVMELKGIKEARKKYAIDQAGAILARAVAVPCLATLDKEIQNAPPPFMGELPNLGNCAIVKVFVEYGRI